MNIESYLEQRKKRSEEEPKFRDLCITCMQPTFGCYCEHVQLFDPKIKFVILIHPIEVKRRIATGRMSHLVLQNSELIQGLEYSKNERVNEIIDDPAFFPVVLSPGIYSKNLTIMTPHDRAQFFPEDKKPIIFVLDGTWATAKKMMRQSPNLSMLPRICFSPPAPSNFRVRKQPAPECVSTIEAIHHTLELLGDLRGFDPQSREHDKLLFVFDQMVQKQLSFIEHNRENSRPNYRRELRRLSANA